MGKVNRGSLISTRRRIVKASVAGGKRSRNTTTTTTNTPAATSSKGNNLPLPPPPPSHSMVLDEDSGFGGDQSLDSESSLLSPPNVAAPPGVVLPSLAMVPQTKLLLVSLLQGGGGLPGSGSSHSVAVGACPPTTTQGSVSSNGTTTTTTSLTTTHHGGVMMSRGADKETQGSHSMLTTAAHCELSGAAVSTSSHHPPTPPPPPPPAAAAAPLPSEPHKAHGNAGHKVVEGLVSLKGPTLQVDLSGEEAQELPASHASTTTHNVPPLVSFRDVSLLSSLHQFKGNNNTGNPPMLRVDSSGVQSCVSSKVVRSSVPHSPPPLTAQLSARSSDGTVELKLVKQPEEQHRARYQTEGSRGAVKDRSGVGHPTVKLVGYSKATTVQIFVGSDTGKSGPHMFYQVCRVSGKNSTSCRERRVDGTVVIEAALQPDNDMTMSCDCVGILKERNVDVEHRFKAVMSRGRKKSTKCRLVFRTFITLPSGAQEVLQVVSQPIACTQPPGVPEICRKSISSCPVTGGEQIFIFGKNFLKDTVVVFQEKNAKSQSVWEEKVLPDKDSLQPIHLIVGVPKYCDQSVSEEVTVDMVIVSGGKKSEPQSFTYLPLSAKKDAQVSETWEDKPLPKGVSPCALQLNRHFAETGTLPQHIGDVTTPQVNTTNQRKASSGVTPMGVTSSTVATSPVRTSRVMLSSAKKIVGRASRLASRNPRSSSVNTRPIRSNPVVESLPATPAPPPPPPPPAPVSESQDSKDSSTDITNNIPNLQSSTVSLENVVEMLKVVQKFPAGSNLYTSVLQLVERLIQSMKDNIGHTCKTEIEMDDTVEASSVTPATTPKMAAPIPPSGSYFVNKGQRLVSATITQPTQSNQSSVYPPTNVAIPMATPVSLFPLTVFSAMPSTVSSGPKVARVAPVAPVAPTTVVSSPGLTRTVKVCVTEAPHQGEPPLKKHRDNMSILPDYTLVRSNQFPSQPQMVSSTPPIISTASLTYTGVNTLLSPKVEDQKVMDEATSTINALPTQMRIQESQDVLSASAVHLSHLPDPSPQNVYHQPLLQNVSQTNPQQQQQQLCEPQSHPEQQQQQQQQQRHLHVIGGSQSADNNGLVQTVTAHHLTGLSERQTVTQHTSTQPVLGVQPDLHVPVSDPLLSQGPPGGLCGVMPSSSTMAPLTPHSQDQQPSSPVVSSTTSALTRSDPLLSQSSPIAPVQMEARPAAIPTTTTTTTTTDNHSTIRVTRPGDIIMVSNTNSQQVSMQNEVTSAINLSETELLNYFDPNCFDNV